MSLTTSEMKSLKALVHEHSQSRHPVKLMIVQAACNVRSESAREGVATDLGRLKAKGYVVRVVGNRWVPTPSGKQAVGYPTFDTKVATPNEPSTKQAEKLDDAPVTDGQPNADKGEVAGSGAKTLQEVAGLVSITDGDGLVTGLGVATPIKSDSLVFCDCGKKMTREEVHFLEYRCGDCAEKEVYDAPEPVVVTAQGILDRAGAHMRDRAATYDKPEGERSMGATVGAFREVTGLELTEEQGWLFMSLLKAVRSQQGGYRADSYEDGAAYFALAGEAAGRIRQ
uniref:DUF6378 domain-containing protein n=1 Tax=Halomonas sp. TaxID=1486246 RepID=UPI0026381B3D|nr:DUF6378 domain-containing protein [Halomonas sp.]